MKIEGVRKLWNKYKYVALVVLIGVGLLLWPSGSGGTRTTSPTSQEEMAESRDLEAELAEILEAMDGVGAARVLLTLDTDGERQLAQDTQLSYSGDTSAPEDYDRRSETVLVDGGDGDETVVTQTRYPTYRGALVVCQGGDRAEVKLAVTEAVSALTGLTADRVVVAKCQ
jgi:stage III sporulation protein AG